MLAIERARRAGRRLVPDRQRRRRPRDRLHRPTTSRPRSRRTSTSRCAASPSVFDRRPRILIEPGRSLVGNAGVTAYTVGTVKEIPGVRTYVAVDGGMSDNLRPMLYGARYEALIADRAAERADTAATIAGMHCESGDILVRTRRSPSPAVGDVLVTPATGAYGYAMANNYNGVPRPAGDLLPRRRRPRGRPPRDLRRPAGAGRRMSAAEPIRIGLLGRGTVGGAFAELLAERGRRGRGGDRPPARDRRGPDAAPRATSTRSSTALRDRRRADRRHRPGPRLRARARCAADATW